MSIYHIVPINDLKDHFDSAECECEPSISFENGDMIITHNSYDLREIIEQVNDILNNKPGNSGTE